MKSESGPDNGVGNVENYPNFDCFKNRFLEAVKKFNEEFSKKNIIGDMPEETKVEKVSNFFYFVNYPARSAGRPTL